MTYRTAGKNAKKGNAVHPLLQRHWGWSAVRGINSGTTCAQISQSLPTHPDEVVKQDVTIVVCMLNGIAKEYQSFSETSTIAAEVRSLFCRMMGFLAQ